jgi:glutamyl-tRNA reductase
MHTNIPLDSSDFFIAGINYKTADAATRGTFAVNIDLYHEILNLSPVFNINGLFVLSTCNRTEIYGFADTADRLINLLCSQTTGSAAEFKALAYIKRGADAIEHLFSVAAGIDSQILGDYEIVGQLKQAVKFSKDHGYINCFLERLVNSALQASKDIKNNTSLSNGSVSVAYAAVQYIKENVTSLCTKRILLIGTGKIGRNSCLNLINVLGATNITLMNRSEEKAANLATELNLQYARINEMDSYILASDIILVATNSCEPAVLSADLINKGDKLVIDLSIPYNVEPSARQLTNVKLVNVDEISKMKDETLQNRERDMPKAKSIITEHIIQFMDWYQMRRNAPALNAIKTKLNEIGISTASTFSRNVSQLTTKATIQRVVNGTAGKMRTQDQKGCYFIEAINEFMSYR